MARNKHPEETVGKILRIARRLFTEKGYEQTSIQDIVDELGMSKGAIYHHFKTKQEILERISEDFYCNDQWFEDIRARRDLNGLQKLRAVILFNMGDEDKRNLDAMALPLMENPHMVVRQLRSVNQEIAPRIAGLIQQGVEDGSMRSAHPQMAAEVLLTLVNLWANPALTPMSLQSFMQRIDYLGEVLAGMGIPVVDDALRAVCAEYYRAVFGEGRRAVKA